MAIVGNGLFWGGASIFSRGRVTKAHWAIEPSSMDISEVLSLLDVTEEVK